MDGINERNSAEEFRSKYYELYNLRNGTRYGRSPCPRYDGGRDRSGRNHRPVWPKLAAKLESQGINITDYLEEVFAHHHYVITKPQDTVSEELIREYRMKLANNQQALNALSCDFGKLGEEFDQKKNRYNCSESEAASRVLNDLTVDVSPLAKYIFGMKYHAELAAAKWLSQAYNQYRERKIAYDTWCAELIPDNWK